MSDPVGFEPTAMGIESPMTPTNVAVTGAGGPAARGPLPSTATDEWFTAVARWIDISGLTYVGAGIEFSALKRACYLFVYFDRAKAGTSRVRCTFCRHFRPVLREWQREKLSRRPLAVVLRASGSRTMSPKRFCARIVVTRPDTLVISASAFDAAILRGVFGASGTSP
ncbi:MAG TPA: hypothetical protein VK529_07055 [Gemmatimonadaceae bacterium]|nr:hypothetical protein [Gemmatimonadaceae bacterium]